MARGGLASFAHILAAPAASMFTGKLTEITNAQQVTSIVHALGCSKLAATNSLPVATMHMYLPEKVQADSFQSSINQLGTLGYLITGNI